MSAESVRNVVSELAEYAEMDVRRTDRELAESSELHPHALRYSLASYMLVDEDMRLVDVRNRLRHRSISMTEHIYNHFQRR